VPKNNRRKKAIKAVKKADRKAVRKGITEAVVERAVKQEMGKVAKQKHLSAKRSVRKKAARRST
jgi:hypothetical protein